MWKYLLRLICCKNGIEVIKHVLLSFQATEWLKRECVKMLIFSGVDDVNIYLTISNNFKSIKLLLPPALAQETEVSDKGFSSADINLDKFLFAYSLAYCELAFENKNFEERLCQVANYCILSVLKTQPKQMSDKIPVNVIAAGILYATCSDATMVEFAYKKVDSGRFATLSTAASQFEISTEELKKFVKQVF